MRPRTLSLTGTPPTETVRNAGATLQPAFYCRIFLLSIAGFTAACSSTTVPVCPAPVPYTLSAQNQVADELETLPPDAMTRTFIRDYGIERAKLRACQ